MAEDHQSNILAEVGIAPARKLLLVGALFALGVVIIGFSWTSEANLLGRSALFVMGAFCVYQGEKIRRTPDLYLQLTDKGLFQSDGTVLATSEQMKSIDRGALALKPSNGFVLVLNEKLPNAWVPGLWWRLGKRVGVGGVASAGAAKFMAEQLAIMLKPKG